MIKLSAKSLTLVTKGESAGQSRLLGAANVHIGGEVRPRLWIRTAAGSTIGFGHLKRSLILAALLQDTLDPLFLLDASDAESQAGVKAHGWRFGPFRLSTLWSSLSPPAAILVDTRQADGTIRLLQKARGQGIPVISIHDLGLSLLASDVVIDGSILPSTLGPSLRDAVCYTGTRYLVLDPFYCLLHQRPKHIPARIKKVVVNLGGGDSSGCYLKILEGLRLCNCGLEVIGIPGFVRWGQRDLARINWQPLTFRWAAPEESVPKLLFDADLAITAGGLSVYEALCVGTPTLAVAVDDLQHITVSKLAEAEACVDLGLMKGFRPAQVPEVASAIDMDRRWRNTLSVRGRGIVDGCGAERVSFIIRQKVLEHAGRAAAGVGR